ncbi:hypothetical protein CKO31_00095 [Thiohalocapsa halophila]|uniref:Uncharacterized protein n=1 Tax=Thiohalocapsa halophila TaxID=69359 RepID=A0ABS1CCG0_9GAMM|nr:hypothetical protein [Thiohalocapsa halophila]MBK1629156.1 hypothetical protein [Thiohalocapsa halophila]
MGDLVDEDERGLVAEEGVEEVFGGRGRGIVQAGLEGAALRGVKCLLGDEPPQGVRLGLAAAALAQGVHGVADDAHHPDLPGLAQPFGRDDVGEVLCQCVALIGDMGHGDQVVGLAAAEGVVHALHGRVRQIALDQPPQHVV